MSGREPETLASGDGWSMRMATPADGPPLCELFKRVHLPGDLDIVQERDPDFFALLRLHHGAYDTCVGWAEPAGGAGGEATGAAVGCGSVVSRGGWFGDEQVQTGYLCDLRVAPGFRGGLHLAHAYDHFMREVTQRHGAELFTTVIFDSNKPAIKADPAKAPVEIVPSDHGCEIAAGCKVPVGLSIDSPIRA